MLGQRFTKTAQALALVVHTTLVLEQPAVLSMVVPQFVRIFPTVARGLLKPSLCSTDVQEIDIRT